MGGNLDGMPRTNPSPAYGGMPPALLSDPAFQAEEEGLDPREYWRIVMRHKWQILGLAIVVSLLALMVAAGQQPLYRATATVMLEEKRMRGTSAEELAGYYSFGSMQFLPT